MLNMEMSESLSVGGGECEADPALTGLFRSSLAPLVPLVPLVEKCLQQLRWRILSGEKIPQTFVQMWWGEFGRYAELSLSVFIHVIINIVKIMKISF